MTSYRELAELYGEDNISTWSMEELIRIGLTHRTAEVLAHTGLPRNVPTVFSTEVDGDPEMFSEFEFSLGGQPTKILIIGGPPGDPGSRYFLDVYDGLVGMFSFSESSPYSEAINSTLDNFVTFLHLYGVFHEKIAEDPDQRMNFARDLATRFREQDALAFAREDGWWSAALEHLQGDTNN